MSLGTNTVNNVKDTLIDFVAGSLGGIALVYAGQPLDTVKVKMQTFPKLYRNMFDCIKQTITKEGFGKGLYAGTVPAIAANVAENSVLFAAYGGAQKLLKDVTHVDKVQDLSVLSNATAGLLAAFCSSFTLCPTELVKCKMQAFREVQQTTGKEFNKLIKMGPYKITQKIIADGGVKGLFKGLNSTMAREMPGYFVFFGAYELVRELFTAPGKTKDDIGALQTMFAGAVAGMAFWTVIFPADVVKSRMQVSDATGTLLKILNDIWKKEGAKALYNGLGPTLIRTIPATATLFFTVEQTKKVLHSVTS